MEIVFFILSIILSLLVVYSMGRLSGDKTLIEVFEDACGGFVFVVFILNTVVFFTILCFVNNSIWDLPYLIHNID